MLALGKIYFYKIYEKSLKNIFKIERKIENSMLNFPVVNIRFSNFQKNIISISYDDGITEIIKLCNVFSDSKHDEINCLSKIINNLMI